jgi:mRNA interferase HicA
MKRVELERRLCDLGWKLARHGRRHDVWSKGDHEIAVPRHREINEYTAKAILKAARGVP